MAHPMLASLLMKLPPQVKYRPDASLARSVKPGAILGTAVARRLEFLDDSELEETTLARGTVERQRQQTGKRLKERPRIAPIGQLPPPPDSSSWVLDDELEFVKPEEPEIEIEVELPAASEPSTMLVARERKPRRVLARVIAASLLAASVAAAGFAGYRTQFVSNMHALLDANALHKHERVLARQARVLPGEAAMVINVQPTQIESSKVVEPAKAEVATNAHPARLHRVKKAHHAEAQQPTEKPKEPATAVRETAAPVLDRKVSHDDLSQSQKVAAAAKQAIGNSL